MKIKIYLEKGESEGEAEEFLAKAFHGKHEERHVEKFEDPLLESLLAELDQEMQQFVLIGGFQKTLEHLISDNPD